MILRVCAAPGALETLEKCGGPRPPPFARVSGAPGAAQTPKMTDFRSLNSFHISYPSKVQPRLTHSETQTALSMVPRVPGNGPVI